jgi:PAS domain S-box-containing protein
LRDTLEALTYPFYVINVSDYTVATANRAALGSSGPVPPGLTCYHMTHRRDTPCGGEQHPCPLRRVTDSREPVTVEHVHYNASGEARHVEVHGYPIFDQDGDLLQMIEYTWDITDRRQAEEALRRERDLVAQLMETSPISITMAGRDGEIIFANARAEEVLGLSRAEITSRTYDAPDWRIADIDGGPFAESELPFRRVMATKKPVYDVRHAVEWPDGRRRILSINGAPLLDPSGDIERVVFAIEDITEQVRAERERIRQIEDELRRLEEVAALPGTAVSARAFGLQPLREALPNVFQSLSDTYASLLDQALDQKAYRHAEPDMDLVRDLAERLGALGATPRDVVDVHVAALRNRSQQANPVKAKAYASEGRLVALRVMGELASYYRRRCVKLTPRTAADRREAGVEEGTAHYE